MGQTAKYGKHVWVLGARRFPLENFEKGFGEVEEGIEHVDPFF